MASTTSTRRVLSDLNVNTPIGKSSAANSPQKGLKTGGELYTPFGGKMKLLQDENTFGYASGEGKRGANAITMDDGENSAKRRKIANVELVDDDAPRGFLSPSPETSPSASPSSSFGNSTTNEMNDSQNTILTLPDEIIYPTTAPPTSQIQATSLTPEELRAKARAIRLRLSLASYKVRTNQIDVPISRLEIRSSATSLQTLPQLRRAVSNTSNLSSSFSSSQQRRTALPNKPASSLPMPPHYVQQSTTWTKEQDIVEVDEHIPSSPPVSSRSTSASMSPMKGLRGGLATPILPRQREGLLNPPMLGADMDLSSSVVKGRAADGLLSLMRMAN